MLRRYVITHSLMLSMLFGCAPPVVPEDGQCGSEETCSNASASSTETTSDVNLATPPAAATGLPERLRPIEPNSADPSTELGDPSFDRPTIQNPSDDSLLHLLLGDTSPIVGNSIDPFTGQLLDIALLPDLFTSLTDSLIGETVDPNGPVLGRTFLEQSCRNRGIEDFICRQRYGS